MTRKGEIEDALPRATGLREKRALLRSRNHGIVKETRGLTTRYLWVHKNLGIGYQLKISPGGFNLSLKE